jgi:hypothetical protein
MMLRQDHASGVNASAGVRKEISSLRPDVISIAAPHTGIHAESAEKPIHRDAVSKNTAVICNNRKVIRPDSQAIRRHRKIYGADRKVITRHRKMFPRNPNVSPMSRDYILIKRSLIRR